MGRGDAGRALTSQSIMPTVSVLRARLKALGLSTTGRKAELEDRLAEAEAEAKAEVDAPASAPAPAPPTNAVVPRARVARSPSPSPPPRSPRPPPLPHRPDGDASEEGPEVPQVLFALQYEPPTPVAPAPSRLRRLVRLVVVLLLLALVGWGGASALCHQHQRRAAALAAALRRAGPWGGRAAPAATAAVAAGCRKHAAWRGLAEPHARAALAHLPRLTWPSSLTSAPTLAEPSSAAGGTGTLPGIASAADGGAGAGAGAELRLLREVQDDLTERLGQLEHAQEAQFRAHADLLRQQSTAMSAQAQELGAAHGALRSQLSSTRADTLDVARRLQGHADSAAEVAAALRELRAADRTREASLAELRTACAPRPGLGCHASSGPPRWRPAGGPLLTESNGTELRGGVCACLSSGLPSNAVGRRPRWRS